MKIKLFSIKLFISAGKANASPPIGPILGQYRLNLIEFCKDFNSQTIFWEESVILPVLIIGYLDGDFEYIIKIPTTNFFLKKIFQKEICSSKIIGNKYVGLITVQQLYELIFLKLSYSIDPIIIYNNINMLCGTISSTGLYII